MQHRTRRFVLASTRHSNVAFVVHSQPFTAHSTVLWRQSGRSQFCYIELKHWNNIWNSTFIFIPDTIWHNLMRYCAAWHTINGPTARFHFAQLRPHISVCIKAMLRFRFTFQIRFSLPFVIYIYIYHTASRKVAILTGCCTCLPTELDFGFSFVFENLSEEMHYAKARFMGNGLRDQVHNFAAHCRRFCFSGKVNENGYILWFRFTKWFIQAENFVHFMICFFFLLKKLWHPDYHLSWSNKFAKIMTHVVTIINIHCKLF